MKRWLMAVIVLGATVSLAYGDYVIIKINLGVPKSKTSATGTTAPDPMGGNTGVPGSIPYPMGGDATGSPYGKPTGGYPMGPMGMGTSNPPGYGVAPVGVGGGPMGGATGFPMGMGDPMSGGVYQGGSTPLDPLPLYVLAIVETKKPINFNFTPVIEHKWGKTTLFEDGQVITITPVKLKSVEDRFKDRSAEAARSNSPEKMLDLAEWTLSHGLMGSTGPNHFAKIMDDLAAKEADSKVPSVKAAVAAYTKVKAEIDKAIESEHAPTLQFGENQGYKVSRSKHYALLYYPTDPTGRETAEVKNRLKRLEQNFQGFYYWFALRGQALPMPKQRLVAMLTDTPEDFQHQYDAFDRIAMVSDGFYARRDNIAVFSATRLDEPYEALNKYTKTLWQNGWDFDGLLKGKGSKPGTSTNERRFVQTLALAQKVLIEEAEIASVSHEGTRQLLAASGLLPKAVTVPSWAELGTASFFETGKGAFWESTGAPSWTYLVDFKLAKDGKTLEKREDGLLRTITDKYFREAKDEAGLKRARMMSWSLTYYLAHRRLDGLMRYFGELSQLPRDMEFEDGVLLGCFVRAFNLSDPAKPNGIDTTKFTNMAKEWYDYIDNTPLPVLEVFTEAKKDREERLKELKANPPKPVTKPPVAPQPPTRGN